MQDGCNLLLVCIYENDIIYISSSQALLNDFKNDIMKVLKMTDLGFLHYFVGIEVKQGDERTFITQRKYTEDLLNQYGMKSCKAMATLMNTNDKLQHEDGSSNGDAKQYRRLIGKLMYVTHTQFDICFFVGMLSRFMNSPTKSHLGAAK